MIDDLRPIAIFAKTVEHGSFRAAAQELRLSPSVVSHHIAQLEERLGLPLLYRSTRRLRLTQDGERLLKSARIMLDEIEGSLSSLRGVAPEPSGELRISLPALLSQHPLMGAIAEFAKRHPKVQLDLVMSDERHNLIKDGFDFAIRMGPDRKRAPNRQSLFKSDRWIVASPSYLQGRPPIIHPQDLEKHSWIELTPVRGLKPVLKDENGTSIQLNRHSQISVNDVQSLFQLAKAGAGLASVPQFMAQQAVEQHALEIILPQWNFEQLDIFAEWPANPAKNALVERLIAQLSPKASE